MVILLLLWRAEGYHQSAVGHLSPFIHECRTYYLNSRITTESKPKLDESTGMYRYYDHEGREVMIKKDDVTQIMER
ncbi:YgdI/YgdR family lipoprotein [Aeromonas veronii]